MSEYDDYSQKLFHQCQQNSLRDDSNYQAQYIDFNPNFGFSLCRVENVQCQQKHFQHKKLYDVDTDYQLRLKESSQTKDTQIKKQRKIRITQVNVTNQNLYLKTKRGTAKQTMQLNINFKTIFCNLIKNLVSMKLLKKAEKYLFLTYKSEPPSFKSLAKFLDAPQNIQSKIRLKQLMKSSSIIVKIQQSNLRMDNKIVMLKFLEVMRSTVSEGNCENKWKKVVS